MHLEISKLRKLYGSHVAVDGIDLSIGTGEFAVILGPSGCGKTTTLRCLAGLEKPNGGSISIGDQAVVAPGVFVPPERRNIGMIFQSYALWPHLTVFENVAFPFEARRVRGPRVRKRVMEVLALVGLEGLADRSASLLSGGQMQRVALARALGCEPSALLFDEPLSNLDMKLRHYLRVELRQLQQASGATAVFVTHDQAEAAALADRVIVMRNGRIEQNDPAERLFSRPANRFVADFIGVGNLLPFEIVGQGKDGRLRGRVAGLLDIGITSDASVRGDPWVWFRPETVKLERDFPHAPEAIAFEGVVVSRIFTGVDYACEIRVAGAATSATITMRSISKLQPGDGVSLRLSPSDVHLVADA